MASFWGRPAPDFFPSRSSSRFAGPVPRYPSQLFEAATQGLVLFIVMLIAVAVLGMRRPGMLAGIFAKIGYAVARVFCEVLSASRIRRSAFLMGEWLTMGMLLSLPLALVGIRGDQLPRGAA